MSLSAVGNIQNYSDLTEDCSRGVPECGISGRGEAGSGWNTGICRLGEEYGTFSG